ncbi:MAG: glycosyltransferase family 4 protein [Candidatus Brockarchaeota archaeon]|nr:glycosyltransferase family 4 protein [Candidatus Brockarchaeota archaeon]
MKFLLVTFDFPPSVGGIQTRVENYVKNLVRLGHEVTLVHLVEPEEWRTYFEKTGRRMIVEQVHGATVIRFKYLFKDTFKIFLTVARSFSRRPDVVHVFSGINLIIGNLFLVYGLLKGCKIGSSLFGKDYLASRPNPAYFLPLLFSLLLAQRIGVNSKSTMSLVPRALRGKARILYPGVDVEVLEKAMWELLKQGEGETILFVGRMVRRKGPDLLLKAFAMLLKDHPNAKLVMVGDGPFLSSLKDLARQLKLENKVEFTGALRGKALYSKYAECDVFAMPSRQTAIDVEGFGMVFLEAGFFGKPSVGTRTGGIPEAVLDGETGILVPQDDVNALRDALSLLLKNRQLARRLGEKARERVLSEFRWEKATLRFLMMFS